MPFSIYLKVLSPSLCLFLRFPSTLSRVHFKSYSEKVIRFSYELQLMLNDFFKTKLELGWAWYLFRTIKFVSKCFLINDATGALWGPSEPQIDCDFPIRRYKKQIQQVLKIMTR